MKYAQKAIKSVASDLQRQRRVRWSPLDLQALPGAGGLVVAEGDVLSLERVLGDVVVAFHQRGVVTFGDDGVVPGGFHCQQEGVRG